MLPSGGMAACPHPPFAGSHQGAHHPISIFLSLRRLSHRGRGSSIRPHTAAHLPLVPHRAHVAGEALVLLAQQLQRGQSGSTKLELHGAI